MRIEMYMYSNLGKHYKHGSWKLYPAVIDVHVPAAAVIAKVYRNTFWGNLERCSSASKCYSRWRH
jgi:hypothetical protein